MAYYHDIITEKSWRELKNLSKNIKFILIGGWAIYLYSKTIKSKDIDIIVDYPQISRLRKIYDVSKNERLKKYEARRGEVQIDVYLPHYSFLGIPVEDLMQHSSSLEGFTVLKKEWLFILKLYVLSQRVRSVKGEKDFLDLLSLFQSGLNETPILKIIKKYSLEKTLDLFIGLLNERTHVPELNLNPHTYKKIKTEILKSLK